MRSGTVVCNSAEMERERKREKEREREREREFQTVVPFFFEYIPCAACFIVPAFLLPLREHGNLLILMVTFYPVIDPICLMYFVRDYRRTIGGFICR